MGEHFIEGSVEVTSIHTLIEVLKESNKLQKEQNEILKEIRNEIQIIKRVKS